MTALIISIIAVLFALSIWKMIRNSKKKNGCSGDCSACNAFCNYEKE